MDVAPVPVRAMVCVVVAALSLMVMDAAIEPEAVGANCA